MSSLNHTEKARRLVAEHIVPILKIAEPAMNRDPVLDYRIREQVCKSLVELFREPKSRKVV